MFLLLTEDFGAWQDRDPFYGVREGFVFIGSQKAFPWAQIGILSLSACLLFIAYTSYKGYSQPDVNSENIRLGYLVRKHPRGSRPGLMVTGMHSNLLFAEEKTGVGLEQAQ